MAEEGYLNNFYQGGYSSLKPGYGDLFTGYNVSAGSLGMTTDPRTANILKDASSKLSSGVKHIELALVSPEIFDSIPKQHFKEINRLGKLVGSTISVHGPVMDSAGMSQQGFSEAAREAEERRIADVIERSHEINPEGNINVVFHSAEGIPGTEWQPTPEGKKAKKIIAVDRKTGQMIPIEAEQRYYPGQNLENPEFSPPEKELEIANRSQWANKIDQVFFNKERADEILNKNGVQITHLIEDLKEHNINPESLTPTQQEVWRHYVAAENYLQDVHKTANELFSTAYKYGTEEQRTMLKNLSEKYKENLGQNPNPLNESRAMQDLLNSMKAVTPDLYVPIEKFAVEKSSKTFGNAAFEAYKKFKDKAPIISIENPPAGFALSTGEDLKNLVKASREQFVKKAVNTGISEQQAREQAEKLIGATWDVGHINMIRKQGFGNKELIKETEEIAPYVKHIHLSDNFGFQHTELPMGMGNVPLKEMLEKLPEKDVKKIVEAGNWWQHFQTNPLKESMQGVGSPMYMFGSGPNWNQTIGLQQGYFSGYGQMLPPKNYQMWGSGFSMASLPTELGGQMPGGGRMSGTPME